MPARGGPIDLERAHRALPPRRQGIGPAPPESRETAGADRLCRAPVARPADRGGRATRALRRRSRADARSTSGARASSTSPAPSATRSNWGRHLGGAPIPQAHPTGYPLYRLEWQGLGSLRRRLRNCMTGMRAEPYPRRRAGHRRTRALPDAKGSRPADGDARRAAVSALPFGCRSLERGGRDTQLPTTSQPPRHATVVPSQPGGRRSRPQFQVWRTVFH